LGVSLRTVYRDIQTLIGQGAAIDGEAGVGFVLRPGFVLPPLMFSDDEIAAVLPADLRDSIEGVGLMAGPGANETLDLSPIREAMRAEHKLAFDYADAKGALTR